MHTEMTVEIGSAPPSQETSRHARPRPAGRRHGPTAARQEPAAPDARPPAPRGNGGRPEHLPEAPEPYPYRSRAEEVLLRAVNIVVALVALTLLVPAIVAIAIAIKLDSRGPVLYRQIRIGLDRRSGRDRREAPGRREDGRRSSDLGGKPFLMYKFRTMRTDAESETGPVWATETDSRTTRVGRFLRKYRLDEIPQFWNVLKGDMCVVGPRPERPSFVGRLQDEIDGYALRQRVPPGITGWAQVNQDADRSIDDVLQKLRYDLEYASRRSLWFDLRIMMRTLPVMLERERVSERDT